MIQWNFHCSKNVAFTLEIVILKFHLDRNTIFIKEILAMNYHYRINIIFTLEILSMKCDCYRNIVFTLEIFATDWQYYNWISVLFFLFHLRNILCAINTTTLKKYLRLHWKKKFDFTVQHWQLGCWYYTVKYAVIYRCIKELDSMLLFNGILFANFMFLNPGGPTTSIKQ